ncbi:hypothetical protein NE237_028599 [Protea cynaroides]|uniref:Uncharacterized protein n=1 Tax=Protea cynaroides TaxID=273540 RepID=A0A9Q0JU88_9MAGN|nr:hypothetical protein NE237_028599 [Protea cynaroides]
MGFSSISVASMGLLVCEEDKGSGRIGILPLLQVNNPGQFFPDDERSYQKETTVNQPNSMELSSNSSSIEVKVMSKLLQSGEQFSIHSTVNSSINGFITAWNGNQDDGRIHSRTPVAFGFFIVQSNVNYQTCTTENPSSIEVKVMSCNNLKAFNFFQKQSNYAVISIVKDNNKKELD